ncbi:uncharacterized protein BCR38DRAFT_240771 [Pseudomassariella vexata]|uniref:Uncharacterized protein n=1 Tax=Pseudomassariella vexata TaxID=1141098 RepID=A0A1Y2DT98_9PEZI|nr:uncharacterized protein BCR38DRAFT_240771 [Pseudomassariella vexata]ORY62477.1 hypothetical protein BCR38DRAFT_240771 [Pseudomassariella vexata]
MLVGSRLPRATRAHLPTRARGGSKNSARVSRFYGHLVVHRKSSADQFSAASSVSLPAIFLLCHLSIVRLVQTYIEERFRLIKEPPTSSNVPVTGAPLATPIGYPKLPELPRVTLQSAEARHITSTDLDRRGCRGPRDYHCYSTDLPFGTSPTKTGYLKRQIAHLCHWKRAISSHRIHFGLRFRRILGSSIDRGDCLYAADCMTIAPV